jgi:hypothetical protein
MPLLTLDSSAVSHVTRLLVRHLQSRKRGTSLPATMQLCPAGRYKATAGTQICALCTGRGYQPLRGQLRCKVGCELLHRLSV